jgi:hypothetical protein
MKLNIFKAQGGLYAVFYLQREDIEILAHGFVESITDLKALHAVADHEMMATK